MTKYIQNKSLVFVAALLGSISAPSTIANAYVCSGSTPLNLVKRADVLFTGKLLRVEKAYLPVPNNALKEDKKQKRTLSRILTFEVVKSYKGPKKKVISIRCGDTHSWCSKLVIDSKIANKIYMVDGQSFPSIKQPYFSANFCDSNKSRLESFKRAEPYLKELLRFPNLIDQMIKLNGSTDKSTLLYTKAGWYELWGDEYRAAATWQILMNASEYKNSFGAKLYNIDYVEKKLRNLLTMRDYEAVAKLSYSLQQKQRTLYTRHAGELASLFLGHNFDARQIDFNNIHIGLIDLTNKDFRGIDLSSTYFNGTDLSSSRFEGADLRTPDPFGNGLISNFSKATYDCNTKFPPWFRYSHINYIAQMVKTDGVCKNRPRITKD